MRISPKGSFESKLLAICKRAVECKFTRRHLAQLGFSPTRLAREVFNVVRRNLLSGRAQHALDVPRSTTVLTDNQVEKYTDRVIVVYLAEHERVELLADGDDATWSCLQEMLSRRAYHMLRQWSVAGLHPKDEAADFGQQACEAIYSANFPYDVAFNAWATVILHNLIRKRYTRSRDLIDRLIDIESLDNPGDSPFDDLSSPHELLHDPTAETLYERVDIRQELMEAIRQLPTRAQQNVIIYTYLYGWSDDRIARKLGKTKQAVYNLRHRALQQLKGLLDDPLLKDDPDNPH